MTTVEKQGGVANQGPSRVVPHHSDFRALDQFARNSSESYWSVELPGQVSGAVQGQHSVFVVFDVAVLQTVAGNTIFTGYCKITKIYQTTSIPGLAEA